MSRTKDREFLEIHRAWRQSWFAFVSRVTGESIREPTMGRNGIVWKVVENVKPPPRLLTSIFKLISQIPDVANGATFMNRDKDLDLGKPEEDDIVKWGKVLTKSLNESTRIKDISALGDIVSCLKAATNAEVKSALDVIEDQVVGKSGKQEIKRVNNKKNEFDEDAYLPLPFRRHICSYIINCLGQNSTNCFNLMKQNALEVISTYMIAENWQQGEKDRVEYEAVTRLADFLVKCGQCGMRLESQDRQGYKAREWARLAYRSVKEMLDPKFSVPNNHRELLDRIRASGVSAVLVRISPKENPAFYPDQSAAVFEVPGFSKLLVHWFYQSQDQDENPKLQEDMEHVIGTLRNSVAQGKLQKHHGKGLLKLLKANTSCASCGKKDPSQPMLACCIYCRQEFYCSKQCAEDEWDKSHSQTCKHKWKADVKMGR